MAKVGVVLPDEGHGHDLTKTIEFARAAENSGLDSVWKGEASLSNGAIALGAIAQVTDTITLGTGILNVYSDHPPFSG
jgi:alkanesulfonate monooxygenase SsuD/methylene tetrahydromethanopterin reductase-like flavin-dependent oxidoreductase (luciferase family)